MNSENQINVLTWNANSIKEKINELKVEIFNNNHDVISISETRIDDKYTLSKIGYKVYRFDRNSRGGGVALLVKNNIKHRHIILPNLQNIERVATEVDLKQNN